MPSQVIKCISKFKTTWADQSALNIRNLRKQVRQQKHAKAGREQDKNPNNVCNNFLLPGIVICGIEAQHVHCSELKAENQKTVGRIVL